MARDPYTVLGISKSASESEIKSAFRRLAKRYHPDTNSDDPKAQERFSEVNSAYEIVGDKDKRAKFDRGEIDAAGQPRFHAGFGSGGASGDPFAGFGGFSGFGRGGGQNTGNQRRSWSFSSGDGGAGVDEILREFMGGGGGARAERTAGFGGAAPERGQDLDVVVTVTLDDLASDEKLRVSLPTGRTVDVRIPPGAEQDQQIRLRGLGHDSPTGGQPGDAILTLRIGAHPIFQREGQNLRLELPVTLYDAALGAKVRAPTLNGSVNITIPPGSSGGKTLRLRGLGLPTKSGGRGDLLVTLQIDLPDDLPDEFLEMMRRWREDHPYQPRSS
ncbi:DnaJ C-terminal domain-containing protein [Acuticoccus sp. I52.16.1]|uniref:DnaJ C-terminal domain-containing protein n=1 Tax=Acuticoccus sp. I52.16.1 TaxID=2928472 RepID=UPI001FD20865|nr:J domain-containing protein [Acuticoccus sp. I52.16.1]UOM37015.1 J domain-containing protein [Acuticoccus sp. I52.16.1]